MPASYDINFSHLCPMAGDLIHLVPTHLSALNSEFTEASVSLRTQISFKNILFIF